MFKRNLAAVLIGGLVLGGGAVAWAQSDASRPTVTTDVAAAVGADNPDATTPPADQAGQPDPAGRRAAVQKCLADAGIVKGTKPTADQRRAARQCLKEAGYKGRLRGRAGAGAILKRTVHGTLTIRAKGGSFQTVTYDRGTEKSLDGDTLVITRPDGPTVTVKLTATTKFRGVKDASGLQAGRPTVVVSDNDGNAVLVGQRPATAAPPAPAG